MRRSLTWLAALPFAAASVLAGHALAYRVAGVSPGDVHGYLSHAPEIVLVLVTLALAGLAIDSRARRRSAAPIASLGIVAFVAQEHLERFGHTGQIPFLLTTPTLWIGIALQVPLAVAIWFVARRLAADIAAPLRRERPRIAVLPLVLTDGVPVLIAPSRPAAPRGRGPPLAC